MQFFVSAFSMLPTLETDRLLLRPLKMSDASDLFEYARDPMVSRHVLWEAHVSLAQSRQFLREARRQYRRGLPGTFGIELKENHKMIGTIGFMWVNLEHRSAEVGYSLSRVYWNQGYMTEALREVVRFAFDTLRLNRVEAQHELSNPASGRVMEKSGMVREGTLRQRLFNKGQYVDVNLYAILSEDYRKHREEHRS